MTEGDEEVAWECTTKFWRSLLWWTTFRSSQLLSGALCEWLALPEAQRESEMSLAQAHVEKR